jgi:hypothetical protein
MPDVYAPIPALRDILSCFSSKATEAQNVCLEVVQGNLFRFSISPDLTRPATHSGIETPTRKELGNAGFPTPIQIVIDSSANRFSMENGR